MPDALAAPPEPETKEAKAAPTVDVTMQLTEGKQYFVNRITFTGNTTTRDNVIRREVRILEGNVFSTEALKYSVKRLNQLGYFKNLEGNEKDLKVDKVAGKDNQVDVTLKLEEQNRNQLTFGAGVSQYEGVFGQLSFQTANFLGRGESLTLSLQAGDRAQNYQLAFTEPFLFDRNMTGGFDIYKRNLQYVGYYTQRSTGGNMMFGFPVGSWARTFMTYSYEQVRITDLSEALLDPACVSSPAGCSLLSSLGDLSQLTDTQREQINRNPFLVDSLLIGQGGKRTISKVTPTFVQNTVDNPIFPTQGKKLTASMDLAVLGGNTQYYKPSVEAIWFHQHDRPDLGRVPRAVAVHQAGRQDRDAAGVRAAVPRRRVQRPRLRHPVDRADGAEFAHRARRQQEPAVQRRIPDHHRRPGAARAVRRRRTGARRRRPLRLEARVHEARRAAGAAR